MTGGEGLTVVVPHYGSYGLLRKCLDRVLQTGLEDVVVVEDGCRDPAISAEYPRVHFDPLPENVGFAAACNRGLESVGTPFVAFLNNDVLVTPHWHRPLVATLRTHPEVVACQPKVKSAQDPSRFDYAGAAGGFLDRYGYPFCRGRIFDVMEVDEGQYDDPCEIFWASGAAFVARVEDLRQAGGFDPVYFAYMEEIDLCWRLRSLGRKVVAVPASEVLHLGSASWRRMPLRKSYLLHRNNVLLLLRNAARRGAVLTPGPRLGMELASAAYFLARGEIHRSRAVLQALGWNLAHLPRRRRGRRGESPDVTRCVYPGSLVKEHFLKGVRRFSGLGWRPPSFP